MKSTITILLCVFAVTSFAQFQPINRKEVVQRHNIHINKYDSLASLTVGNGKFAYTTDITGMQTFPEAYKGGVPLGTQSDWGWHSFPNTENYTFQETLKEYDLEGRKIPYAIQIKEPERNKKAGDYFRANPHRLQLGNIGLEIQKKDGSPATINDIKDIDQALDMWTGEIRSKFTVEGEPVEVITYAHPEYDMLGVSISSKLLSQGRLQIKIRFPYPTGEFKDVGVNYTHNDKHSSKIEMSAREALMISHTLDTTKYGVFMFAEEGITVSEKQPHYFIVKPATALATLTTGIYFSQDGNTKPAYFEFIKQRSIGAWDKYWKSGGAIDFAGSTDKRAFELERRVVLSQYLMRVQEASYNPPQETGLTFNSWFGKPHMEMNWWHAVHYALWGRSDLMENSMEWYFRAFEGAKAIAARQGFTGARWQKMTDNEGRETASSVGSFLIWQQPHLIYMAELLFKERRSKEVLDTYKQIVFATADFMASFPTYDRKTKKYNLGKGLIPAQETFNPVETYNPTYELAYWSWALNVAQIWRTRLGMARNVTWDKIINNLAPLPKNDSVYLATESTPDCYTNERLLTDHPAVLGAYSAIPAANGLDSNIMKNTLNLIFKIWHWDDTWGWDYPLTAMTATRLNMPDKAVDALLMPVAKNTYLVNGHNWQDNRLTIYMPGNGGLLSAVAMMCAGYEGCKIKNPGFPKDGKWKVKWEGLKPIF
jgi:hypothetical protein